MYIVYKLFQFWLFYHNEKKRNGCKNSKIYSCIKKRFFYINYLFIFAIVIFFEDTVSLIMLCISFIFIKKKKNIYIYIYIYIYYFVLILFPFYWSPSMRVSVSKLN